MYKFNMLFIYLFIYLFMALFLGKPEDAEGDDGETGSQIDTQVYGHLVW